MKNVADSPLPSRLIQFFSYVCSPIIIIIIIIFLFLLFRSKVKSYALRYVVKRMNLKVWSHIRHAPPSLLFKSSSYAVDCQAIQFYGPRNLEVQYVIHRPR